MDQAGQQIGIPRIVKRPAVLQPLQFEPHRVAFPAVFIGEIIPAAARAGAIIAVDKPVRAGQVVQIVQKLLHIQRRHVFN